MRSHAEPFISRGSVLLVSLDLKRAIDQGSSEEASKAEALLQKIFHTAGALGLGEIVADKNDNIIGLHKYTRPRCQTVPRST